MPGVIFSTAFRFGRNPSSNGMDKIRFNGVVQFGTDHKLNTRNDILIGIGFFMPIRQCLVGFISRYPAFLSFLCTRCTTLSGMRSVV
jgi:hypothetical protein